MKSLLLILFTALAPLGRAIGALQTANAETSAGTHEVFTRRADAAHSYRYLLVKSGSDALHAAVAGVSDYPVGSSTDTPGAAEDVFNVQPLNDSKRTRLLRCATALAADVDVYTSANGFVAALPAVAGTYYRIGRTAAAAVQEAASNYVVEVVSHAPVKTIVIATATGTAATDIAALFAALATGPAQIKSL
ncbi:MAG: hypothetical protein ABI615_01795 [Chthoniobacterales bacterium]